MKTYLSMLSLSLFLVSSAHALLPPLYETAREIKWILSNDQLGQKLESGEVIVQIQKNNQGYEVVTNKHRLQVDVVYLPTGRPGPAQYNLHFKEPLPLQE